MDGRVVLIGHDTGWYDPSTWERLHERLIDLLIFDCTFALEDRVDGHMGCAGVVRARDELARRGALASGARTIATHFSHNGGALHEDLERFFVPHTIAVAYDGMRVTI